MGRLKSVGVLVVLFMASLACNLQDLQDLVDAIDIPDELLVTKTQDTFDGSCVFDDCSLREAVIFANRYPGHQTIVVPGGTYNLTLSGHEDYIGPEGNFTDPAVYDQVGDLDISDDVTIRGAGRDVTRINANRIDRAFEINNWFHHEPIVNISELTIHDGKPTHSGGWGGGGILSNWGVLTLTNVTIRYCYATHGGGLSNFGGALALTNVTLAMNTAEGFGAEGGGLYNDRGVGMTATNLLVVGNRARRGGGIFSRTYAGWVNQLDTVTIRFNDADEGGGIYNSGGVVSLANNSMINGNYARRGGGIYNFMRDFETEEAYELYGTSTVRLEDSVVAGNTATYGGGIFNTPQAEITLDRTLVRINSSNSSTGGGVYNLGTMNLTKTTLLSNTANKAGAAYNGTGATLTMINSTVSDNNAFERAAGLLNDGGTVELVHASVLDNSMLGGIHTLSGTTVITNSIIANNIGGDCIGAIQSEGNNLDSDNSCGLNGAGDLPNTQPLAGPLTQVGSAHVHPLDPSSPAINAADSANCPAADQRDLARPQGAACDLGAYEYSTAQVAPVQLPSPTPATSDTPVPQVTLKPTDLPAPTLAPATTSAPQSTPLPTDPPDTLVPTDAPTNIPVPTLAPTLLPTSTSALPASISGVVWQDHNGDGSQQDGENGMGNVTILLGQGSCGSAKTVQTAVTNRTGYIFAGLPAGEYCVSIQVTEVCGAYSVATTSKEFTIVLNPGDSATRSFGFQMKIC